MQRIILLLVTVFWAPFCAHAETLVFSPLPMETPYVVGSQWKPLLSYLERTLGVTLKIDYSSSNDEIVAKFKAGKLDLAYLGPLPYVILKKDFAAAEPLVVFHEKSGEPAYTCAVVVAGEARFDLKKLHGMRVALTQPLSTCGFFATDGLLERKGSCLADNYYRYLGPHDEVALSVVRGEYELGGLKTAIARKYEHLGLTILAESRPLPGLALIANREKVSPQRLVEIRQALLEASPDVRRQWGDNIRNGVSPVKDSDYDGIRQLSVDEAIPEVGNF